jgi:hypothetical protein
MIHTVDVPVGIGQTVYKLGNFNRITETTVEAIILRAGETKIKLACNTLYETSINTLGKTWWLTLEDAVNYVEFKKKGLQNTRGKV